MADINSIIGLGADLYNSADNELEFDEQIDVGNMASPVNKAQKNVAKQLVKVARALDKIDKKRSAKEDNKKLKRGAKSRYIEQAAVQLHSIYEDIETFSGVDAQEYVDAGYYDFHVSYKDDAIDFINEEDSDLELELEENAEDSIDAAYENDILDIEDDWFKPEYDKQMAAILAIADLIMQVAKSKCPEKTGALRDSAKVIREGNGYAVVFGMGYRLVQSSTGKVSKVPIDYATFVHEIGYNRHVVGQAKYLEDATIEVMNSFKASDLFHFKIDYDRDIQAFLGCMIVYISIDGNTPGTDIGIIKSGEHAMHRAYQAWSIGMSSEISEKHMAELINSTFVMTKGELMDVVDARSNEDMRKLDAMARAHVSDFTKRGSFLKTFYHLYGKENLQ